MKERWLAPLLAGEIRRAFSMLEPDVASSDASDIALAMRRDDGHYVLNGRKWFSSGVASKRCEILIVIGTTDADADADHRHSMIAVPKDTPGVSIGIEPAVFGYTEGGGHPEVVYRGVRVPTDNLLGEEGGGFAIARARLGPGRIHHCMRTVGIAERALGLMVARALKRRPSRGGGPPHDRTGVFVRECPVARALPQHGANHRGGALLIPHPTILPPPEPATPPIAPQDDG